MRGRQFWRSFEELAETPEFTSFVQREFPQHASEWLDPVGRRGFLKLMGASLALAGASACTRQPDELIVPYVRQPENVVPGRPLFFATAMALSGSAIGLLAESHEGRPTKIEGNPDHPASLGATDAYSQASVLQLYDPDRSTAITFLGEIRPWATFVQVIGQAFRQRQAVQGAGLRFLTESVSSPTLVGQLQEVLTALPQAKWHQWEPVNGDNAHAGARLAFGEVVETTYRFESARVVVSLGADFLGAGPGSVRYSRDFAQRPPRAQGEGRDEPAVRRRNRAVADRLDRGSSSARARQSDRGDRAGAARVRQRWPAAHPPSADAETDKWITAAAKDLQANRGAGVVVAGDQQPPAVHALAHAMNAALGNAGATVVYTDPVQPVPVDQMQSMRELVNDMNNGRVDLLVILGGNPVYTAPADLKFGEALKKVATRVHLGLYDDETSAMCHWHIPETHYLEGWSDVRAFDGTASIVQPLILPLYRGRSAHEVVGIFTARPGRAPYDALRDHWKAQPQAAGSGLREVLAPLGSQRPDRGHGPAAEDGQGLGRHSSRQPRRPRAGAGSRSISRPIPPSTTDASPTTAGCRSCPSR